MKKLIFCTCFCFLLFPAIVFGSPQTSSDDALALKQTTQQKIDPDSIAGSLDADLHRSPDANSIAGIKDPDIVPLQRGCCSWHQGVCGCDNGRTVCCDNTYSPTCGC